jgi:hypothetical protein
VGLPPASIAEKSLNVNPPIEQENVPASTSEPLVHIGAAVAAQAIARNSTSVFI